ncbi:MAG: isochorismate synthase [Gemmatimonadota bacterium]
MWRLFPDLEATYWRSPAGHPMASVGAVRIVPAGPDVEPEHSELALRRLREEVLHLDAESGQPSDDGIRLFGGTGFDVGQDRGAWAGFGTGSFVLPAWTVEGRDRETVLHAAVEAPAGPASDLDPVCELVADVVARLTAPSRPLERALPAVRSDDDPRSEARARRSWVEMVEAARVVLRQDRLEKVVLCRRHEISFVDGADPVSVLDRLSRRGGEYVFGIRRSGMTFLGASPELLMDKRGRGLRTEALAGTSRVGTSGDRPSRLAAAAERLFGSGKDLGEHALVVRGIVDALEPLCTRQVLPAWPEVRTFNDLAHLSSEIAVDLRDDVGPFTVLRALHPTPAVGGLPRRAALRFLSTVEPVERGWYAGPVGWITTEGDAEIAVGIRSALLSGETAYLYAGAGIVPASDPDAEYRETADKLGRLSAALGVGEISG